MTWTKQRLNNLFFCIGITAVVVMMLTFDVSLSELWQHVCHAGYWMVPILGVWAVIYAINAMSWFAIIRSTDEPDKPVTFRRIFRLTISGYALNYATPMGGLGGEPYRIMELSKDIGTQRATSSVILYAMMHIFAHFWFWFASIILYLALAAIGDLAMTPAIAIALTLTTVFCSAAFALFAKGYRKGLAVKTIRILGKVPGLNGWSRRFLTTHEAQLKITDTQIAALYAENRRAFYVSLALEFASRIVQSTEILFMLLLFGIDCGGGVEGITLAFLHSVIILACTTLMANLIGFLPMQLGVQEGGFVVSIAALGLPPAIGIFISIICRLREIIWIIIGLILMRLR